MQNFNQEFLISKSAVIQLKSMLELWALNCDSSHDFKDMVKF
jgi:hypothetical protein